MKIASASELKNELLTLPPKRLVELCLRLARFKKENKELLAFLLFDANNEPDFVGSVKIEIDEAFADLNTTNWYFLKKGLRKILRSITKYSRFTTAKESNVEMLVHFLKNMHTAGYAATNKTIENLYEVQFAKASQMIDAVHDDLQFDYRKQLETIRAEESPGMLKRIIKTLRNK